MGCGAACKTLRRFNGRQKDANILTAPPFADARSNGTQLMLVQPTPTICRAGSSPGYGAIKGSGRGGDGVRSPDRAQRVHCRRSRECHRRRLARCAGICRPTTSRRFLGVTYAVRQRLGLTTIGSINVGTQARKELRKRRNRLTKERKRRALGMKRRAEYEASSLSQTRPWERLRDEPPSMVQEASSGKWHKSGDSSLSICRVTQLCHGQEPAGKRLAGEDTGPGGPHTSPMKHARAYYTITHDFRADVSPFGAGRPRGLLLRRGVRLLRLFLPEEREG